MPDCNAYWAGGFWDHAARLDNTKNNLVKLVLNAINYSKEFNIDLEDDGWETSESELSPRAEARQKAAVVKAATAANSAARRRAQARRTISYAHSSGDEGSDGGSDRESRGASSEDESEDERGEQRDERPLAETIRQCVIQACEKSIASIVELADSNAVIDASSPIMVYMDAREAFFAYFCGFYFECCAKERVPPGNKCTFPTSGTGRTQQHIDPASSDAINPVWLELSIDQRKLVQHAIQHARTRGRASAAKKPGRPPATTAATSGMKRGRESNTSAAPARPLSRPTATLAPAAADSALANIGVQPRPYPHSWCGQVTPKLSLLKASFLRPKSDVDVRAVNMRSFVRTLRAKFVQQYEDMAIKAELDFFVLKQGPKEDNESESVPAANFKRLTAEMENWTLNRMAELYGVESMCGPHLITLIPVYFALRLKGAAAPDDTLDTADPTFSTDSES
jgi:hypothetical protein